MKTTCLFPSVSIELSGPEGNAYYIMGLISSLLKQIGYDENQIEAVMEEMKKSDYEHLCTVAKRYIILKDNGIQI